MYAIETKDLCKQYRTRVKGEGLGASFRALLHPVYREIEAVKGISLTVKQGEILAFIGPNGAGKSTTIKMLCGILHPSGGEVRVLGLSPTDDRRALAMRIGTVFGQKSQLWLHLPALDSFTLLAAIYEIDDRTKKRRIDELTEAFALGDFLHTPVRKLSLGQRIRCEVAASLLHDPDILFLDEPTIGLDVVVKQAIRELILGRNRERGTTVFLTSHDPSDIEHLCRRAVVIDHGTTMLDSPVDTLKREYLGRKVVEVRFAAPAALPAMQGVTAISGHGGRHATLTVDTEIMPIGAVIEQVSAAGEVSDITVSDPPMEEIITSIFGGRDASCKG